MRRAPAIFPIPRSGAFTLVEVMTALAVFGVIGIMATQILTGTIRLGESTRIRSEGLADVQRAMDILERDIVQMKRRTVRDEFGDSLPAVTITGVNLMEFTRVGWQNPLGTARTEIQRVAYVLQDDRLLRLFWPVLDRAPDSRPVAQVLLAGVTEARFTAYDDQGEQHSYWPLIAAQDEVAPELVAVGMTLALDPHGHVERLWIVPTAATFLDRVADGDLGPGADDSLNPDTSEEQS